MLEIDGSHGEGGGQLLRNALALAAITGTAIRVANIRARRAKPGLAPQHLTAVRAVAAVCGAAVRGLEPGSREIVFAPQPLRGGDFEFDVGTAGAATLVVQALLPALLSAPGPASVRVRGGTDVRAAPPLDYFSRVLLRLLREMGAHIVLEERRRGYYPRGGGEVSVATRPGALDALRAEAPGRLHALRGIAQVAHLPGHIPERMRRAAQSHLGGLGVEPAIEVRVLGDGEAVGQGGAVTLWAETGAGALGAGRVAERGVPAERLGEAVALELASDLAAGVSLDVHAADQVLIYLALARGGSAFTTRQWSSHAATTAWLIGRFLPARFSVAEQEGRVRVDVAPGPA
ncbi:MAG TPA: RNA 3'-terminal phosphate cyclase [Burkholderiales bacterium]|nr:RNA 3'-terminal phosphate cyclase [Burkholderiales bacterium]